MKQTQVELLRPLITGVIEDLVKIDEGLEKVDDAFDAIAALVCQGIALALSAHQLAGPCRVQTHYTPLETMVYAVFQAKQEVDKLMASGVRTAHVS
jgi:hypothetical protein